MHYKGEVVVKVVVNFQYVSHTIIRNTERDFRGSFYSPKLSGLTESVG